MIKFLYKVIHYEPTAEHNTNVSRSFLLITTLIITLPLSILYLLYDSINRKNSLTDVFFLIIAVALITIVYLLIRKTWKMYLIKNTGFQYYNFGKYNTLLKTFIVLLLIGFIIVVGRSFAFF
jgi:RsiW-degrading membrane proteinase PrsW (M82 family)